MKSENAMKFNVTIPVKPYVKRFLENNYGNPVDFRKHPRESEMFRRMLKKPNYDNEHKYKNELNKQILTVEILVSDHDFYRYGWELSKTDTISFGKYFEKNAKWLMHTVVSTYVSFGTPIYLAIANFQTRFQMEEEYWSYESIQKDFYRMRDNHEIDLNEYAYHHLEQLILINMSNAGAVTNCAINNYKKKASES